MELREQVALGHGFHVDCWRGPFRTHVEVRRDRNGQSRLIAERTCRHRDAGRVTGELVDLCESFLVECGL